MMFNLNFIFYAALAAAAACAAPTTADADTTTSDTTAVTTSTSSSPSPQTPWDFRGSPDDRVYGVTICDSRHNATDCYYLVTIAGWRNNGKPTCRGIPQALPFVVQNHPIALLPDEGTVCDMFSDGDCKDDSELRSEWIPQLTYPTGNVLDPHVHKVNSLWCTKP